MPNTKERILSTSLELFNAQGLMSTTLQTIANEVEISVGNLAYHYKNKQEIIHAHGVELNNLLQSALNHYRNYPNFIDFHIQLEHIQTAICAYAYVFRNLGEINHAYPQIFKIVSDFYHKLLTQIESRFEYHRQQGNLHTMEEAVIALSSKNIVDLIIFSSATELFLIAESNKRLSKEVWNLWAPYLSDKGETEWDMLIAPAIN